MTAPAPRIIPNVPRVRATFIGSVGGAPYNAAFWFTSDGVGTHAPADLATDAAAMIAGFTFGNMQQAIANLNHTSTQLQQMRLDYFQAGSAAVLASGTKAAIASSGVVANASAASQCVVVTSISALAGRSGKGRTFFPATGSINASPQPYEFLANNVLLLANGVAGWLSAINAGPSFIGVGKLRAGVQSLTLGVVSPTFNIRVDGRPDRQEHREKRLVFGNKVTAVTS